MSTTIPVRCPAEGCTYETSLRFDPGVENDAPGEARAELNAEHPRHLSSSWHFRTPKAKP